MMSVELDHLRTFKEEADSPQRRNGYNVNERSSAKNPSYPVSSLATNEAKAINKWGIKKY